MKKATYHLIIAVGLSSALFSCIKKEDTLPDTRYSVVPTTNAFIKFNHFSPDAPQLNFVVNGAKGTAAAPTTAGAEQGMIFPNIFPSNMAYFTAPSGSLKIDATTISSSTTPGTVIATTTHNFGANKFYSYFLSDSVSKISTTIVEDDPSVPDVTKTYIRLANFVSNGTSVNIEIVKTSAGTPFSKIYPNVPYKSVTTFEPLNPSPETYRVFLRHPTTNAKLDSISAFTPVAMRKYTIYARGVLGLTGTNAKRPIISQYANF
jgi:hypothetical protein